MRGILILILIPIMFISLIACTSEKKAPVISLTDKFPTVVNAETRIVPIENRLTLTNTTNNKPTIQRIILSEQNTSISNNKDLSTNGTRNSSVNRNQNSTLIIRNNTNSEMNILVPKEVTTITRKEITHKNAQKNINQKNIAQKNNHQKIMTQKNNTKTNTNITTNINNKKIAQNSAIEPINPSHTEKNVASPSQTWQWPTRGPILQRFSANAKLKGIDISGKPGNLVKAAKPGIVVYSGQGLKGYGKLIIIKHDENFLSAYAHNQELMVKEEEHVKAGQVIAKMGKSDADSVKLHFEIRYQGTPVDPLKYLPKS